MTSRSFFALGPFVAAFAGTASDIVATSFATVVPGLAFAGVLAGGYYLVSRYRKS